MTARLSFWLRPCMFSVWSLFLQHGCTSRCGLDRNSADMTRHRSCAKLLITGEGSVMRKSARFTLVIPLLSAFTALSLSAALAEEPKKPAPKAQAIQPKGPPRGAPGSQVKGSPQGRGGARQMANRGRHFDHDRSHWSERDRAAWSGGHWRPYECRFGRCGYWWSADGYWYWYDHPMDGPPDVISDVEYADDPNAQLSPPPGGVLPPVVIERPPVCVGPVCF
jgi:hypothetical protein